VPSVEELNSVFDNREAISDEVSFPERDWLIIELLYGCGARNGEIVEIDLGHVNPADKTITLRGKGNKERLVPYGGPIIAALASYLPRREELLAASATNPRLRAAKKMGTKALLINQRGGRLTTRSVGRIVKKIAVASGLSPEVHPHTLRHAF